ncbi:MAG: FtsX-like permease family protein [Treponema sp.]|nr:FtsX-like permease family protein [Treponema sp.]
MLFSKLGLSNLLKNKRKTVLTLLTISLGFACLTVAKGYTNYCLWGLRESIINGGVGHFQIYKEGFRERTDDDSFNFLISDYKKIIREFSTVPGVKFVAPRLSFIGILANNTGSATVAGHGGWLQEERALTSFSTIEQGAFPREDESYGTLIGSGVAGLIGPSVHGTATLSVAMNGGAINVMDFDVTGIISSQLEELEDTYMLIPLESAQSLMDVPDSIDTIIIMLLNTEDMPSVENRICSICRRNGLEYRTWDQIVPYYSGAASFYSSSMNIALIVILAIVVFAIINTMLMAVYDRMREIGTMRSIGMTAFQTLRMITAESTLLGVFGCAIGIILAFLTAFIINVFGGIPLPPPPGNTRAYQGLIYIETFDVAVYSVVFILVSILSSLFPARKAVRMSIADTLRWI